ncbi:MAG: ArsR family transcriptional regulator [Candidatus Nitrosopelagicus brevis]|uniref:Putative transcriptional regulator n=1 Tax=uncultured marine thaumarchaeote KM3_25_D06 TaxID=1456104 RepID=A0A075H1T3_9ARCH|nr:putative transcriptional regulator [uncultured marine thaumarchaeote KM3_25_D06]NMI83372.1 ArsR family transcriptional regulator [Candidatus Nitrosopelagicus brevis]|tara:strand:- start:44 stop:934 length:891 start_codon:yes stop_codon:yes gene_type:complete
MARGYDETEVKFRLIKLLHSSKSGISGVEISEKLGINRVTMSKYLNKFAAEGTITQKNIGNLNLWFVDEDIEQLNFPDDYFLVQEKFLSHVIDCNERHVNNLIKNCINSKAKMDKIITEIIIPTIPHIQKLFDDGKIGKSEEQLMTGIISNSLQMITYHSGHSDSGKNVIILSADSESILSSESAAAAFRSQNWNVFSIGDISSSIDVLFDLELRKLLSKTWKSKEGVMIVLVFSQTEEGLKFISDSFYSVKEKSENNLFIVLSGKTGKKVKIKGDLSASKLEDILQWSNTKYENS